MEIHNTPINHSYVGDQEVVIWFQVTFGIKSLN